MPSGEAPNVSNGKTPSLRSVLEDRAERLTAALAFLRTFEEGGPCLEAAHPLSEMLEAIEREPPIEKILAATDPVVVIRLGWYFNPVREGCVPLYLVSKGTPEGWPTVGRWVHYYLEGEHPDHPRRVVWTVFRELLATGYEHESKASSRRAR